MACTSNPGGAWMMQQARNLLIDLDDRAQRPRFLIHDRDAKFSRAFDAVFRGEGMRVICTPLKAPKANAHVERWVGSARRECLDRLLIFSRRQLEHVLRVYVRHYNEQRPHRALDLQALGAAAALLAVWCVQRLPGFAPSGLKGALGHVGAAMVVMHLAVPVGLVLAVQSASTVAVILAVLGVALPPLTYAFVATLWALRVAQNAMPGFGR